ncbi:hypothetical protein K457DRAFT_22561 [Linnemannia elongata AG-77]|uniref:Uncharacterized protein n=1 Tax=Linnemannia elongata AG-77 TaxID=1314771 RepID=A0A197JMG8_9FUNG|nr:hypothetical protein K457DRAFT_22561 [Linnemannia elongata AG-77]
MELVTMMEFIEAAFGRIKLFGVGCANQKSKLALSQNNITTRAFMEARIKNGSKREDRDNSPFYFPAPHISGPDIVFYRNTIQGKMDKEPEELVEDLAQEHKTANRKQESSIRTVSTQPQQLPRLQDYCPTGVYVSMVITYPAEVDKFQVIRPDPEPELECLERVSINIVDNNFPQIFPERHVKFLDRLKQHKRSATEEQTANPSIKSKVVLTRSATDRLLRDD